MGERLSDALRTVAHRGSMIRGHIEGGAKPVGGISGTSMVDARTAHATEGTVRFSDKPK